MSQTAATRALSEPQFAALVDALSADAARREELIDLLREENPVYDQRGAATIVRMRGWILIALARVGLTDASLLFVLEELDAGRDPYLVAAAARALRSYARPKAAFASFVMRAIENVRYHDEPVAFDQYGQYVTSVTATTAVRELLDTLAWLGPHARRVLPEIEALRATSSGMSRKLLTELDRTVRSIGGAGQCEDLDADQCCGLAGGLGSARAWFRDARRRCESIESILFEDQDGTPITFGEFFRGHPSIVVFFYTRCDNPQKCSLTVAKLSRVQKLLAERGLAERIRTGAISYDPAFDLPERLRGYGKSRGLRMDADHRMLRAMDGFDTLRRHFALGVNFIESLVNRHRIEVYVLDASGRIAASFERIHWDEEQLVERAVEVLTEKPEPDARPSTLSPIFAASASVAVALFPKCPVCWATYMSVLGIAGLEQIPYFPWVRPVLLVLMLLNVVSVWTRGRATGQMRGFYLVASGVMAIAISEIGPGLESAAGWGVALTLVGSLFSTLNDRVLLQP